MVKKKIVLVLMILTVFTGLLYPAAANAEESPLPYFLDENAYRYEAYRDKNPGIPFEKVVAYVNADVDKGFYNEIVVVENPDDTDLLLNKSFMLPSGYSPPDLVTTTSNGKQLRAEAAEAFDTMRAAAQENGMDLFIRSGYRSHGSQVASYNVFFESSGRESADRQSARPGHSEHQLGLAVDLVHKAGTSGPLGETGFSTSGVFYWMLDHAHEYGFILRYQKDFTNIHGFIYEPWHWRYVGTEIATRMYEESITTFEEYYGKYLAPAVLKKMKLGRMTDSTSAVLNVSGKRLSMQSFKLNGSNYFRLSDVTKILNDTNRQFNIAHNEEIRLSEGNQYSAGSLGLHNDANATTLPELRELSVYIDGTHATLMGYFIGNINYVRLRDIGKALDLAVSWDCARQMIVIDTNKQ